MGQNINNDGFPVQKKKVTRASLAKHNNKVKKYVENNQFMNIIKEEKEFARKNFEYFNHEVCEGDHLFEIVLKNGNDKPLLVAVFSFEKEKEPDLIRDAPSIFPRKKAAKILGYVLNSQQFIIFSSRENELSVQNPLGHNHDDTFNGQKITALRLNYGYIVHKINLLFRNNHQQIKY